MASTTKKHPKQKMTIRPFATPMPRTTGRNQGGTNRLTDELVVQLQSTVEDLVSKLAKQKYENAHLEEHIRREVYDEYVKLHDDLHRRYSTDRREAIQQVVELNEDRMQLYKNYKDGANSANNSNDEDTPTMVTMRQSGTVAQGDSSAGDHRTNIQDDNTGRRAYAVERKLSAVQTDAPFAEVHVDKVPKLDEQKDTMGSGDEYQQGEVETLENGRVDGQISDYLKEVKKLRKLLQQKDKLIQDLEDTLDEAADKFMQMEKDKQEMLETIAQLKAAKGIDINGNMNTQQINAPGDDIPSSNNSSVQIGASQPQIQAESLEGVEGDDGDAEAVEDAVDAKSDKTGVPKDPTPKSVASSKKRKGIMGRQRTSRNKRTSLSVVAFRRHLRRRQLPKPFHSVVKLNRAYLLKVQVSPILLHNHKTGVTYDQTTIGMKSGKKLQF